MRVRLRHLLAWCGPGLPVAALGLPLVVYLPPHYAGTLGLPLATVGLIFALVRLVDIPIDPLLGALMDNSRSRFGQFRPWILGGTLVLMLGTVLLFQAPPGVSAERTFLALLTVYIGFSTLNLAQLSWGSKLSPDYAERARVFGVWSAFYVAGTLSVLLLPPLVTALRPEAPPETGLHAMGWFIFALAPLVALLAAAVVPEGAAPVESHRVRAADLRTVLADRRMVRLLAVDFLLSAAAGITGALLLFFFTAARHIPAGTASALLLVYFLAGFAAAPFWIRFASRRGKHLATALASAWIGTATLGLLAVPAGNIPVAAGMMLLAGLPFAAPTFLLRSMLADLNDAQALDRLHRSQVGAETTGLNFALLTATQKLGFAAAVGLLYPLLALIGFDPAPGAANSAQAVGGLELLFAGPSVLLALAAAMVVRHWPITADAHAEIRDRLATAGELQPAQ